MLKRTMATALLAAGLARAEMPAERNVKLQLETYALCNDIRNYAQQAPKEEVNAVGAVSAECYADYERLQDLGTAGYLMDRVDKARRKDAQEMYAKLVIRKKHAFEASRKEVDRALNGITNVNMVMKGSKLKEILNALLSEL